MSPASAAVGAGTPPSACAAAAAAAVVLACPNRAVARWAAQMVAAVAGSRVALSSTAYRSVGGIEWLTGAGVAAATAGERAVGEVVVGAGAKEESCGAAASTGRG